MPHHLAITATVLVTGLLFGTDRAADQFQPKDMETAAHHTGASHRIQATAHPCDLHTWASSEIIQAQENMLIPWCESGRCGYPKAAATG